MPVQQLWTRADSALRWLSDDEEECFVSRSCWCEASLDREQWTSARDFRRVALGCFVCLGTIEAVVFYRSREWKHLCIWMRSSLGKHFLRLAGCVLPFVGRPNCLQLPKWCCWQCHPCCCVRDGSVIGESPVLGHVLCCSLWCRSCSVRLLFLDLRNLLCTLIISREAGDITFVLSGWRTGISELPPSPNQVLLLFWTSRIFLDFVKIFVLCQILFWNFWVSQVSDLNLSPPALTPRWNWKILRLAVSDFEVSIFLSFWVPLAEQFWNCGRTLSLCQFSRITRFLHFCISKFLSPHPHPVKNFFGTFVIFLIFEIS